MMSYDDVITRQGSLELLEPVALSTGPLDDFLLRKNYNFTFPLTLLFKNTVSVLGL